MLLIFAVPQTQEQIVEGANFVIFDRAGDTGGVKDEKGLWLACQSTGDSTGGRAPRQCCVFVLFNSLVSALLSLLHHIGTKKRRHCLGPWSLSPTPVCTSPWQ